MKRSTLNQHLRNTLEFFRRHQFLLPEWASWGPETWRLRAASAGQVVRNQLGWDITDFGQGDFARRGLTLFTLRNGNLAHDRKPYAEKIMLVGERQETPLHFHWHKMEDIINRGGGILVLQLFHAASDETLDQDRPLSVSIDGITLKLPAGGTVELAPGQSICLEPRVYHRFFAKPGDGPVLTGEVSMTNDDHTDNRFLEPLGRFPQIEEDEPMLFPLVTDYAALLSGEED